MRMTVITKVECKEFPEEVARFVNWPDSQVARLDDPTTPIPNLNVCHETIHGTRFNDGRGHEVCIGMTREVQKILGWPFQSFKHAQEKTQRYRSSAEVSRKDCLCLEERLRRIHRASFFTRLRFLFTSHI